jgi:hypothetical protein
MVAAAQDAGIFFAPSNIFLILSHASLGGAERRSGLEARESKDARIHPLGMCDRKL